ncbi:hypothetical protein ACFSOZ_07865 [Mesorhizobium newzealandense]|uniref:Uncharacterized protein n=1 Tax=Mesorhizobium newzealandense TaxID=1300302 RepID=A0ABW4U8N7_9HYPH
MNDNRSKEEALALAVAATHRALEGLKGDAILLEVIDALLRLKEPPEPRLLIISETGRH